MTPNPDEAKLRDRLAEAIKRGICARINATKKLGSPSVTPDQLSGAFYDQEIKHHVNAIESELADASRREEELKAKLRDAPVPMSVADLNKPGTGRNIVASAEFHKQYFDWFKAIKQGETLEEGQLVFTKAELDAASKRETDTAMMSVQDFGKLVGRAERAEKLAEDRRESLRWALTYVPVPQHPDGLAAEQYKLAQERAK